MRVILAPRAEKSLRRLSKIDQIAVVKKIRQLQGKQVVQEEKLKGFRDIFRVRIGSFRIVFRRRPEEIYIILIGHRRDIYDLLKRLF